MIPPPATMCGLVGGENIVETSHAVRLTAALVRGLKPTDSESAWPGFCAVALGSGAPEDHGDSGGGWGVRCPRMLGGQATGGGAGRRTSGLGWGADGALVPQSRAGTPEAPGKLES